MSEKQGPAPEVLTREAFRCPFCNAVPVKHPLQDAYRCSTAGTIRDAVSYAIVSCSCGHPKHEGRVCGFGVDSTSEPCICFQPVTTTTFTTFCSICEEKDRTIATLREEARLQKKRLKQIRRMTR